MNRGSKHVTVRKKPCLGLNVCTGRHVVSASRDGCNGATAALDYNVVTLSVGMWELAGERCGLLN